MPSPIKKSLQVFTTYREVKEANPDWSDLMVEDYLALKSDLTSTAESTGTNEDEMQVLLETIASIQNLAARMNARTNNLGGDELFDDLIAALGWIRSRTIANSQQIQALEQQTNDLSQLTVAYQR